MKGKSGNIKTLFKIIFLAGGLYIVYTALFIGLLRFLPISSSAFMLEHSNDSILAFLKKSNYNYKWVDFSDISNNLKIAVVASEDQNFPNHWGFDFKQIQDAIEKNKRKKRIRGASTISQQVAKNIFLTGEKSYLRKGVEAYYTLLLELIWGKKRILEVYLNVAEFGEGIYGVHQASNRYFNKMPSKLKLNHAALLAGILPKPKKFFPKRISRYFSIRQSKILKQINLLGGYSYLKDL